MANRLQGVDPNSVDELDSSSNFFVPYEDLTIFVELSTEKKERTLLTTTSSGSFTESNNRVKINFIEGESFNGQRSLTTKFTELTTSFDGENSSENLGITSIDIDFNSSFAPMITIQFVDVRGSAIFQNENKTANNKNKYSVFFQLPYPIYNLKIKGYYGQPVEYCLHMTKFTSRFNSQSGNFEITASFVGYTYAMLSDMLIGYLKSIEYTKLGADKYAELKSQDPNLMTLDELYDKVSKINEGVKRIVQSNDEYKKLKLIDSKLLIISDIRDRIKKFSNDVDINQKPSTYNFAITKLPNDEYNKFQNQYITDITKLIEDYNKDIDIKIDEKFKQVIKYDGLSINILEDSTDEYFRARELITSDGDKKTTIKNLLTYINKNNYVLASDFTFNSIDNTFFYKELDDKVSKIKDLIKSLQEILATELRNKVKGELDFDPSIRNIVKIFTTAAEVFMYCIGKVSEEASKESNTTRRDELAKVFKIKETSDIPNDATNKDSQDILIQSFYPWPDYRKETDNTLEETYLGDFGVLEEPSNVDELLFIDDLLRAFIIQANNQSNIEALANANKSNWIPSNPLDTRIFGNELSPYKRINPLKENDLLTLVLIRATTFLGLNSKITSGEITKMAEAEAQAVVNDVQNKQIVQAISNNNSGSTEVIPTVSNEINFFDTKIFANSSNIDYKYDYILSADSKKFLPINNSFFKAEWPSNYTELKQKQENGTLFLGNQYFTPSNLTLDDDGSIYVKIVENETYTINHTDFQLPITTSESLINLESLKNDATNIDGVGFNAFAGPYGVQEFSQLNWNIDNLDGLPLSYLFYSDSIDKGYGIFANGLGYFRNNDNALKNSEFDVKQNKYKVASRVDNILDMFKVPEKMLHDSYGKNRELFNNIRQSKKNNISYPYIHFTVDANYDFVDNPYNTPSTNQYLMRNISIPISLFGSNFYYGQSDEKAKAFLFLHTLPWNGLTESYLKTIFKNGSQDTEILNLFKYRTGFVSAPKLWACFIGGLLWRFDSQIDPIIFSSTTGSLIPMVISYPQKNEFMTLSNEDEDYTDKPMSFKNRSNNDTYKKIDSILLNLPRQVKNEFIEYFLKFSVGEDWTSIKSALEINVSGTWLQVFSAATALNVNLSQSGNEYYLNTNNLKTIYGKNFDNYIIFNPYLNYRLKGNYFLEIKDNAPITNILINLLQKQVFISNMSYRIWDENIPNSDIIIDEKNLEDYFNVFLKKVEGLLPKSQEDEEKTKRNSIFGTSDENLIKFMLYRTCKNINDKWITQTTDDNVFFQCGVRNQTDSALATKRTSNSSNPSSTPRLIDSFRFVDRAFKDIGDDFALNPFPIYDMMGSQPNTSLYNLLTSILSSNNFDFIALPNFIDYRNNNNLKNVFKPYPKYSVNNISGPSFICMYVGQTSKHLDFGGSNYPNDGFDFRDGDTPSDFNSELKDNEDPVTYFKVRFGQQNQNIFKDISLDQSEFAETAESLQIMDDISKKGTETYRTLAGQNIYNVYSVRSYKVEIEMMGNAMIQPMMYFQLDNIPMFHGAYLITRVKHSIKPNSMSTNFTGTRIRKPATKILDTGYLFMSLLETLNTTNIDTNGVTINSNNYNWQTSDVECGSFNVGSITTDTTLTDEKVPNLTATKPIRDLVARVESQPDNYNAYNIGDSGAQGSMNYKPSDLTIKQIKELQALPNGNEKRIFAVGKYQLIPSTFSGMTKALGFNDNEKFDSEKQEKAGIWLIKDGAGGRKGLKAYFANDSNGTELDLQKAITDLALEFASMPTFFGPNKDSAKIYSNPGGYYQNTSLYGGTAGNPASSKFCALDVAKALIQTWKNLNPGKTPEIDYETILQRGGQQPTA